MLPWSSDQFIVSFSAQKILIIKAKDIQLVEIGVALTSLPLRLQLSIKYCGVHICPLTELLCHCRWVVVVLPLDSHCIDKATEGEMIEINQSVSH